jgi:hypothetical protein
VLCCWIGWVGQVGVDGNGKRGRGFSFGFGAALRPVFFHRWLPRLAVPTAAAAAAAGLLISPPGWGIAVAPCVDSLRDYGLPPPTDEVRSQGQGQIAANPFALPRCFAAQADSNSRNASQLVVRLVTNKIKNQGRLTMLMMCHAL